MKAIDILEAIGTAVLDLVFPRTCIVCGKIIPMFQKVSICDKCMKELSEHPPLITSDVRGCDMLMSPLLYKSETRNAMLDYKFKGIKYPGYSFAYAIACKFGDLKINPKNCVIIAVPIHVSRDRDYNQSEVIAQNIARMLDIEYIDDALYKIKPIARLSSMDDDDKMFYIRNSFGFNYLTDICGKDVIVVDDIYTSGTTLCEISRVLRINGAAHIYALTACYSRPS